MSSNFSPATTPRPDNISLIFQEVFTVVVRVRSSRHQSPDAESFRYHVTAAIQNAAGQALSSGYDKRDVLMVTLAIVGFVDESVLISRNPIFSDWQKRTLQHEFFEAHRAGEIFFDNLNQLLSRGDSQELADVLELHQLCLLLGFAGRYSAGGSGELQALKKATADKIRRIRGVRGELSPNWASPRDFAPRPPARGSRVLLFAAIVFLVLTVILFTAGKISLTSAESELEALAAQRS